MKTTREIGRQAAGLCDKLNELRKQINTAVDKIRGVSQSVIYHGIDGEDSGLIESASTMLGNAADEIMDYVYDDVPHIAAMLKERFEYDKNH